MRQVQKIKNLQKKFKVYTICIIVLIIIILFFILFYYMGNGFNANDNMVTTSDDCRVMLWEPGDGDVFYSSDNIEISGSMWGGIPNKVLVWDERYNIPLNCMISASTFGISVNSADISEGNHVLCVQGQTTDGRWTSVERVTVQKRGQYFDSTGQVFVRTWSESFFPEPIATIFRPVEEVLSSVVVYITGGTSDDDLNGDNIPDELEQSPVTPRHNPMNVPLSIIIVFALLILVIIVVIFYVIRPYLQHRYAREREIMRSPEQREYMLKMQKSKDEQLAKKLSIEKNKRITAERKLHEEQKKHLESKSRRPVNIFISKSKNNKNGGGS